MLKLKAHVVIGMLILTIVTQSVFGITVTSNLDVGTPGSGTEVCVGTDTGSGLTLREAIEIVNLGGTDLTIDFDLPAGKETIFICSQLPTITPDDVTIDGANTAGSGVQVTIDGTNVPTTAPVFGLRFLGSSNCIVQNLTLTNFATVGNSRDLTGISFSTCPNGRIRGVTISNLTTTGTNSECTGIGLGNSNNVIIGSSGSEDAVTIDSLSGDRGQTRGINIGNSDDCTVENVTITDISTVISLTIDAFGIVGAGNSDDPTITNCTIEDISSTRNAYGIRLSGRATDITNTTIRNISSIDRTSGAITGEVIGIGLIDTTNPSIRGDCSNNTIENLTSGNHTSGATGIVQGIFCERGFQGSCSNNEIRNVTSGNSTTSTSGAVTGIRIDETISPFAGTETFDNNTIHNLNSGSASVIPGVVIGIDVGADVETSLSNNDISKLESGTSATTDTADVVGIQVGGSVSFDVTLNTICSLTSGEPTSGTSGDVTGISVADTITLDFSENSVFSLRSSDAEITGNVTGLTCRVAGNCSENIVTGLESGIPSLGESGTIYGIRIVSAGTETAEILQDCNQNKIGIDLATIGTQCFCPEFPFGSGSDVGTELICEGSDFLSVGLVSAISATRSGDVFGISVENNIGNDCNQNMVINLESGDIVLGTGGGTGGTEPLPSGDVIGIQVPGSIGGNCSENTVSNLLSGMTSDLSGLVKGIEAGTIAGSCNENCLISMISGDAGVDSAEAIGIDAGIIGTGSADADCSGNTIHEIISGDATTGTSGDAFGIRATGIGGACNANWITVIVSGSAFMSTSGIASAIQISGTVGGSFSNNSIGVGSPVLGSEFGSEVFFGCFDGSAGTEFCALGIKSGDSSGTSGGAQGIKAGTISSDVNNNAIECIISGDSSSAASGPAQGIDVVTIEGSCNENCITTIISGNGTSSSFAVGIEAGTIGAGTDSNDCNANTIHDIQSGDASTGNSGNAFGIVAGSIGGSCNHNWITTIKSGLAPSGTSGETGAVFTGTIGDSCSNNAIGVGSPILGSELGTEVFFNCFDGVVGTEFCALGIQSGDADDSSGAAKGIKAAIITNDANSNNIRCIISGDSATANSGEVVGLESAQIMGNCNVNTVAILISGLALLDSSGEVNGIDVNLSVGQDCNGNDVSELTSGESENNSGDVFGISLGEGNGTTVTTVVQNCNNNMITQLDSGESHTDMSGDVAGIDIFGIVESDCSNNSVTDLTSAIAPKTGNVTGINATIVGLDAENNTVTDLTSGDTVGGTGSPGTGTELVVLTTSGDVTGINIDQQVTTCNTNTIADLTSGIAETTSGRVHGISVGEDIAGSEPIPVIRNCNNNNLSSLISGLSNTDESGNVTGIFVNNTVIESCSNNEIVTLTSGSAPVDVSGNVAGINILIGLALGNCSNNSISSLTSSTATETGDVTGIKTEVVGGNSSNNTITDLTSGIATITTSGEVIGIDVSSGIIGACSNNSISNLDSSTAFATGKVAGIETPLIGQDCSNNTITMLASGDTIVAGTDSGSGSGGGTGPMPTTSGDVTGIDVNERIFQDCNTNSVTILTSGDAHDNSGRVFGIALGDDNGSDSGTEPTVQNCNDNTIATLESGTSQTESSGDVTGLFVNEDVAQDCSNNTVSSLTSGVAPDTSGEVNGIDVVDTIGGECTDNTVSNLTNSPADITLDTTGIEVGTVGGFLARNTVFTITSEPGATTSGNVFGINVESLAQGTVFNNTINNLEASGTMAVGISINELQADALNNTVIDVALLESGTNGSALLPAEAAGILIGTMSNDQQATCNDTEQIQSLRDGNASGLWIKKANSILVSNNTSKDITGLDTAAAHGIRLGNKNTNESVQSSLGEENLIRNIDGGDDNGFGITIENNQSTKNKLFGNSISEIETLAINYENPPFDGILNITSITCLTGNILRVQGNLIPLVAPIGEYRIELFASPDDTPPESYQLIGFFNHTPAPPAFDVMVPLIRPLLASEYVTATATALTPNNKNTTPVSDPLDGCNSIGGGTDIDPICAFISVCDPNCLMPPSPPPSTSCPVPVPTS